MTRGGLPHSDIFGSKLVCSSPKLFAACHVLHRLLAPRHSPYTLSSLTIRNSKLTLTNCLHISWSATVPCNTACVVVGKNYRVQNIQLSKIRLAGLCRQSVNVGLVGSPHLHACRTVARSAKAGALNFPDVGVRETQEPHSLTETFQRAAFVRLRETAIGLTQTKRSGEYRSRTGDLLVANQALSQLS